MMTRTRRLLPLFLTVCLACSGAALAADISGTWRIQGSITPTCTIVQTGNSLSGACRGPGAEGPLSGSVDGQAVRWVFTRTNMASGRPVAPVEFSGTVSGQSLSGTMTQNGGNNPQPFTAQLQPGAAPIVLASAAAPQAAPAPPPQTPPPSPAPAASAPAPAINNAPPRAVWDVDLDGSATHRITGMVCPAASGALKRDQTTMYDKVGFDVSCNYDAPGARITIYLTMRDPSLLQQAFDVAKRALVTNAPGAVPRDAALAAPAGLTWLQAAYDEQGGTARSEILYAQLSGWEYEIRATFRADNEAAVTAAIADLTATVRRTAEAHLAACAADGRRADGTGQRNQDLNALTPLSAVAAVIAKQTVTTPSADAVWCPDIGFGMGNSSYVWWHNIKAPDAGPVDRVTDIATAAGGGVFVVRVPPDSGAGTYAVVVDSADSTAIAGIFNGRPSFRDVTGLVLQRPFGIYARIGKPDGAITVYKPF